MEGDLYLKECNKQTRSKNKYLIQLRVIFENETRSEILTLKWQIHEIKFVTIKRLFNV